MNGKEVIAFKVFKKGSADVIRVIDDIKELVEVEKETIRANSPAIFQTGDRAVGRDDYKVILDELSFILKSICWGVWEINKDAGVSTLTYIAAQENTVHLACISDSGVNLTDEQVTEVIMK